MTAASFGNKNSNTGIQLGVNNAPIYFSSGRKEDPLVKLDQNVLASLSFPQMLQRRDNIEKCHDNTCEWILDLKEYRSWKRQSRGLLWIKGKPGAGKSTIMAFLHDRLERPQLEAGSQDIRLDFFFSARGAELQRTPLGMFRSLLNQIFYQDVTVRARVREVYEHRCKQYGSREQKWEWPQRVLEELLTNAILASASQPEQHVTVFVDALDETGAESAQLLATYFHRLLDRVTERKLPVQICISCRHYPIVATAGAVEIRVEDHNNEDISSYIKDKLIDTVGDSLSQAGTYNLAQHLTNRANGTFQWVHLILLLITQRIREGESLEDIHVWLRDVPVGLREVYVYILKNVITLRNREQSLLLFQWVCLAERPLTITELRYAFATSEAKAAPFPRKWEKVKEFVESDERMKLRMMTLSGGLVEVIGGKGNTEILQVVHQSVNDFLRLEGLELLHHLLDPRGMRADCGNVLLKGQAILYRSCLLYLVMAHVPKGFPDNSYAPQRGVFNGQPLLPYARRNLFIHAKKAAECRKEILQNEQDLLQLVAAQWESFRDISNQVHSWDWNHSYLGEMIGLKLIHMAAAANLVDVLEKAELNGDSLMDRDAGGNTALHAAAESGCKEAAQWLHGKGLSHVAVNKAGFTPLIQAAASGHLEIVEWLLHEGNDLEAQKEEWQTAMDEACRGNHLSIVEMLLDAGADPNGQAAEHRTPLQTAAASAGIEMIQMLLVAGADPNSQSKKYGNALEAALVNRRIQNVQMLLAAGADPNTPGGKYGNVLQTATYSREREAIQLLLAAGADPNLHGGHYGSALQAAAWTGEREAIHMLLAAGADPNLHGGHYGSALQAAAWTGEREAIQILIAAGADPNTQGGHYGSALHAAVHSAEVEAVQILLAARADPNIQGGHNGSALHAAAWIGTVKLTQLLLDAGASPITQGGYLGNALQAAAWSGEIKAVQMFLAAGADPNTQGGYYGNALQAAAYSAEGEVIQLLLAAGANPHTQGGYYGNALQAAAHSADGKVIQLLLAVGADPNMQAGWHGNALQAASWSGERGAIQILLDAGADPNTSGGYYGNALQAASWSGRRGAVQILLEAGAEPNTSGGRYGNALQAAVVEESIMVVQPLLDAGADPLLTDELGRTALHVATSTGDLDMIHQFRQLSAPINVRDSFLRTPLHEALLIGNVSLASELLELGADPSIRDSYGRNAMDWTPEDENIIDEFRKACPSIVTTSGEMQRSIVRQSIFQISRTILSRKLSDPWPLARHTGRLLLSLNEEQDTRYIFRLAIYEHEACLFQLGIHSSGSTQYEYQMSCDICNKTIEKRAYVCRECASIDMCSACAEATEYTLLERPPHHREHKVFEVVNFDEPYYDDCFDGTPLEKLELFLATLIRKYPGPAADPDEAESPNDSISNQALGKTTGFTRTTISRVMITCATVVAIFALLLRHFYP